MVVEGGGVGAPVPYLELCELLGVGDVAHVEEAHLHTLIPGEVPLLGLHGLFAYADECVLVVGVEIVAVAGDLELPQDLGVLGISEVDDEEGIHLLERDQVAALPHEPGGVDVLPRGEPFELPSDSHCRVEDVQVVAGPSAISGDASAGGGYPEVVSALVHGELVEHPAGDRALGHQLDCALVHIELVDGGSLPSADRVRHPLHCGEVDVIQGSVDSARGSHEVGLARYLLLWVLNVQRDDVGVTVIVVGVVDVPDVGGLNHICLVLRPDPREDGLRDVQQRGLTRDEVHVVPDHPGAGVVTVDAHLPLEDWLSPVADVVDPDGCLDLVLLLGGDIPVVPEVIVIRGVDHHQLIAADVKLAHGEPWLKRGDDLGLLGRMSPDDIHRRP